MKIASRKNPEKIHEVTDAEWIIMQNNGLARNFKIVPEYISATMIDKRPDKAIVRDFMTGSELPAPKVATEPAKESAPRKVRVRTNKTEKI